MKKLITSLVIAVACMACSQDAWPERSTHQVDSAGVTRVLFWPPGLSYLATGGTAVVELQGLKRGFICSRILECALNLDSSGGIMKVHPICRVELPENPACPLEPNGLDTTLPLTAMPPIGAILYLKTPADSITDSARIVSAMIYPESLVYIPDTTGKVLQGRFLFRDSTSAHPLRKIMADSMLACETFGGAVFSRSGDTLKVRFRRLRLDSARHATLPPCLGPHADSTQVVFDRFGFPPP